MADNDLAAKVAALRDGDRVRATFQYGETTTTAEGPVNIDGEHVSVRHSRTLRWSGGWLVDELTAVEVLAPALPPEPPVGSGVFHDGRLWQRGSNDYWTAYIDGQWIYRRWAEIQPCVPAVPAPEPLPTDEPDVPANSMAVFLAEDGNFDAIYRWDNGLWGGRPWSHWTDRCGAPLGVHAAVTR